MKIVCDSCSTKYSISDDKVRGKVFKIRCKKCSHIIVVKGTSEEGETIAEAPSEAGWHVVIEGEQVGPLGDSDVRARLSRGDISTENYVWKEGFADWQRLADVPDFADFVPATVSGELYSEGISASESAATPSSDFFAGSGGLFGTASREGGSGASASLAPSAASGPARSHVDAAESPDSFGPTSGQSSSGENADLFGMATQHAAPVDSGRARVRTNGAGVGRHDGGRIESLTAQRSDNSVLFSLSNLQSLAAPGGAAIRPPSTTTNTEGSGLIDIRAMAASTLRSPTTARGGIGMTTGGAADDDLSTFAAFSTAAPVLLPLPSNSGVPRWVYGLIGLGAAMLVAMLFLAVSILRKPVMVEQVVGPPNPPALAIAPATSAPSAGARLNDKLGDETKRSKPMAEADLPPRQGGDVPAEERTGGDKGAGRVRHSGKTKKTGTTGDGKVAGAAGTGSTAAGAVASAEPEKPKATKGSLDDLLEGALKPRNRPRVDEDSSRKSAAAVAESANAGPLSKGAVVAGMNAVKARVNDCYTQFKVPGMAMVTVNIGKNGKVDWSVRGEGRQDGLFPAL